MAKLCLALLPMSGNAVAFPDVLVPVPGQPRLPSDLIGATMKVPSSHELADHLDKLGATPTFTKHMEVFQGPEAMDRVTRQLQSEIGLAVSSDEVFECAQEPTCLQIWTTADAFTGRTVRITKVLGSWSMSAIGVGNVCHVNANRDVAFCHRPSDAYKSGLSWLALGVPVDSPLEAPLPVAVRCHDMGPSSQDAPCHLLSGNEFMAVQVENIDTYAHSDQTDIQGFAAETQVVSLGWVHPCGEQLPPSKFSWQNDGGLCLDVAGGVGWNGAPIQMWSCNGLDNQAWLNPGYRQWCEGPPPADHFTFGGADTPPGQMGKYCLDVPGGKPAEGQTLWLWDCYQSQEGIPRAYQWSLEWTSRGEIHSSPYELRIYFADETCFDKSTGVFQESCKSLCVEAADEGSSPFLATCSGSNTQVWDHCPYGGQCQQHYGPDALV